MPGYYSPVTKHLKIQYVKLVKSLPQASVSSETFGVVPIAVDLPSVAAMKGMLTNIFLENHQHSWNSNLPHITTPEAVIALDTNSNICN